MKYRPGFLSFTAVGLFILMTSETSVQSDNKIGEEFWVIENESLKAVINRLGGELTSLRNDSREYIWQGQSGLWSEHSPILFPIVGGLRDNEYSYKGERYKMTKHGFAKDMPFELRSKSTNTLSIGISSSSKTKKSYPFDFDLEVSYLLNGHTLEVRFLVRNTSSADPLYFSIGAHPAFNCPINSNEKRNEYQILFEPKGKPKTQNRADGLLVDQTREVLESPGVLSLGDELFEQNALVFSPNSFSEAALYYKPAGLKYLTVHFKGFPFLGIWSEHKTNQVPSFVCIEPWYGLNDYADHDQDLTRKRGIVYLSAGNYFETSYSIEINKNNN